MFEREFNGMNTRPTQMGLAFPFILFSVFMWIVSIDTQSVYAQWESIGTFPHQISNVYFMNEFGHPEIGFVGMFPPDTAYWGNSLFNRDSTDLWRTSDGGKSWNAIPLVPESNYFGCRDFTFKDSLNGWMTSYICYQTTNGGITWNHVPNPTGIAGQENSIFYQPAANLLLLSIWDNAAGPYDSAYFSRDDGNTWTKFGGVHTGYSFSGMVGFTSTVNASNTTFPSDYTTDGGITWSDCPFYDECWQPCCIPGTTTFFVASEKQNRISRSDDGGKTWRTIFTYGPPYIGLDNPTKILTGCIRIDRCGNLYVMTLSEGLLMSSDEGASWNSIGGPLAVLDARFCITSDYIYAGDGAAGVYSGCELCPPGTLWRYRLSAPPTPSVSMLPSSLNIRAGDSLSVTYNMQSDSESGFDSVHFHIHYDDAFDLKDFKSPAGWRIMSLDTTGDVLDLWIASTGLALPSQLLVLNFGTALEKSSAKIYLDSVHFYSHPAICGDSPLSVVGPDSVEIAFTGCGDSLMLAAMQGEPPFSIESIQPNPASGAVQINFINPASALVSYEVIDALGSTRLRGATAANALSLDVTMLPQGVYFFRAWAAIGIASSKQFVIMR
jgi:hypothetical protein